MVTLLVETPGQMAKTMRARKVPLATRQHESRLIDIGDGCVRTVTRLNSDLHHLHTDGKEQAGPDEERRIHRLPHQQHCGKLVRTLQLRQV